MITENILDDQEKNIDLIIKRLEQVPGMTITTSTHKITDSINDNVPITGKILDEIDKVRENFKFTDSSGRLRLRDNILQIPHVSIYDAQNKCQFRGYVGLIHADGLREEIKYIKQRYGK
ncbi:MAG: hypothetical protein EAZ87_08260 [Nostocales cyanobacterium]|nr:MAG: hypothetical protein EAZ87_08260 [Nostocales cyanobacterium]